MLMLMLFIYYVAPADAGVACRIPEHFAGDYYSIDDGEQLNTLITNTSLTNEVTATSTCVSHQVIPDSEDGQGRFDARILLHNKLSDCYQCYILYHRTVNVVQYLHSTCVSLPGGAKSSTLSDVCGLIPPNADILTMFRKTLHTVNCKLSVEGTYQFSYEVDYGGGGICDSSDSMLVACQQPGSVYVDNQVLQMHFGRCPEVSTSFAMQIKFQCMGTWNDDYGNFYTAMADISREKYRERFRCLLTRYDQQVPDDNSLRYSMSRWASCASLKTPYDGPIRLVLKPAVFGWRAIEPGCRFPRNFSGTWTKGGEYDKDVAINDTHIHFRTYLGQFSYRDSYYTCLQHRDSRYLTSAVYVGRCEVEYVCWDFMPRHHGIIRWRLGRAFSRLESSSRPDRDEYEFRRACSWSSFTVDSANPSWKWSTFMLNPPSPVTCPIGGRYHFRQFGNYEELYRTRIRGVTERPRHRIDCTEYVSVIQSCDSNPKKITVDAEYCATLDHTGKPIGEYDEPDREMICVGYWMEDMLSYLVTYDREDPVSPFRCWIYERLDWRHVVMSMSSTAWCGSAQDAFTYDPQRLGALHLDMRESERLFDECPQRYDTGANPYDVLEKIYVLNTGVPTGRRRHLTWLPGLLLLFAFTIR